MDIAGAVALAVGISSLVTFGGTKLWDAYSMQKKYRTIEAAEKCMKERSQAETDLKAILKRMEKRLQLGNLAISDLWEKAGLPLSRLKQYEKALDIKLRDNNQT